MTALAPPPESRTAPRRGAGRVVAPVGVALAAALGAVTAYVVFVRTELGQRIDELAMRGADVHHPRLTTVLDETLGRTSLLALALVCLLAAAIGLVRRRLDLAVAAAVLVLGANLTTQFLKSELTRPVLVEPAPNSLPSGHTTAAASVAFVLVLVLPQAARAVMALIGAGYVAVIAIATVWAGWHRPSDTVTALLIVLGWGATALAVVRMGRPAVDRSVSRLGSLPLGAGALAGAAVAALGLGGTALALSLRPELASGTVAFLAGAAGMGAAAAATFLCWLRLVSDDGAGPAASSAAR